MRLKWRTTFPLVLAPVLLLLSATSLSAHSELERCTPAPNTVLKAAPREIRCTFSASLVPDKSMLAVVDASKNPVDNKDSKLDPADEDDMTLVVSLNTSKMAKGMFRVQWTVVAEADGDQTAGEWTFSLDVATGASTGTPGTSTTPAPTPTETNPSSTDGPAQPDMETGAEDSSSTTATDATEASPVSTMPPGPSVQDLPAGTGGMVARNYYGQELTFSINGSQYTVPPNNWLLVSLAPGAYTYSGNVFGDDDTEVMATVEIKAGELSERPFYLVARKQAPFEAEEEEEGGEE